MMYTVVYHGTKDKNDKENNPISNKYCNVEKVKKYGSISDLTEEIINIKIEILNHEFNKINQSNANSIMIHEIGFIQCYLCFRICNLVIFKPLITKKKYLKK